MHLTCERDKLIFATKVAGKALSRVSTFMNHLHGLKLETKGNILSVSATNLELFAQCAIPIENLSGDETIIIKGDLLGKIAYSLPDAVLKLKTIPNTGRVEIASGGSTFDILLLSADDYPVCPSLPEKPICVLGKEQLERSLELVTYAALSARETYRLSLTGVNMVLEQETLKVVATNGYRLALKEEHLAEKSSQQGTFLVASESLRDLATILQQLDAEHVEIYQDDSYLFFKAGDVVFAARLIDEAYPDFEKVIPKDNSIELLLERQPFLEALQRVQITAAEESGAVVLNANGNILKLSSQAAEKGEAHEVLPLKKKAQPITISFHAEYLIDALKRMQSDNIKLRLHDSESAGLLEPVESEADQGFLYVCMPIRMD